MRVPGEPVRYKASGSIRNHTYKLPWDGAGGARRVNLRTRQQVWVMAYGRPVWNWLLRG